MRRTRGRSSEEAWRGGLLLLVLGALTARAPGAEAEIVKTTYTYKTVGALPIRCDVYRAAGPETRPVILWIHGGALIAGHRENLRREQMELYVRAGFVVVSIDYRLAPETKLPVLLDDVKDAHRWLRAQRQQLGIDPDRLAVIGHSAGGYLTLMAGFCLQPRPRALVAFYGYGDLIGDWYSKPDPFYSQQTAVTREQALAAIGSEPLSEARGGNRFRFYLYCRQNGRWPQEVVGFDPQTQSRAFDPFCPVRNVTRAYPPTLLLHGDQDTDVPHEQSVLMAREFKRAGVAHELITMKGRGHGFDGAGLKDPDVAGVFERVAKFLQKELLRRK